jgi:superfamily II DNA helicase RecQ
MKFFLISIRSLAEHEQELNGFLCRHKVVSIERRVVENGGDSFWMVSVEYVEGGGRSEGGKPQFLRQRVDYEKMMPPPEYRVFCELRDVRKRCAAAEAVPVYLIFSNEQLAQMVQRRCRTAAEIAKIEGVGDEKAGKYADKIIPLLSALEERVDASSEATV